MSAAQIALAILGVGALIAWHELGHYLVARMTGMRVLKYSLGFGPRLWGFERDGIEYRLSAVPLGGYVHIFGMSPLEPGAREDPRSFMNAPRWARLLVMLAGAGFNYLLAFVLFWVFFASWPGGMMRVSDVTPGSPLATAGVEAGDRVFSVDGRQLRQERVFWEALSPKQPAELVVLRGEGEQAARLDVTLPALSVATAEKIGPTALGGALTFEAYDVGIIDAGGRALAACYTYSAKTLEALGKLALGDKDVLASTSGPPGIVKELKQAVQRGMADFLWLLAFLNISLGLFNLLPVPALDGIKALVIVIEAAIRRDINPTALAVVNLVGLVLLLGLIMVVSVKDILKMAA